MPAEEVFQTTMPIHEEDDSLSTCPVTFTIPKVLTRHAGHLTNVVGATFQFFVDSCDRNDYNCNSTN
eukprot:6115721-Amphidinium_carterae.1